MNKTIKPLPNTLQEAIVYFSDPERCFEYSVRLRWPNGKVQCPRCGSEQHSFISTRRIWFCKGCKKQFTVKVGTIFEDSAIGMDKWMTAVWLIVNCKNGISSYEVGRVLGVTQKSAWFMMHRIRLAMQERSFLKLGAEGFRYNNRHKPMDDGNRFQKAMSHVFGKRLTYAELTGKGTDSIHQSTGAR